MKQQADIVKVIEGYIRLRKAGAQNFTGLCPFHKEKSPSFSVHAVRQFYHCFGCRVSGDCIRFVGKIENVGFPEAVRIVAQKCGIPLPKREFSSPEEAAGGAAARRSCWNCTRLRRRGSRSSCAGRKGRWRASTWPAAGFRTEGIKKFRIGYAPDSFNALRDRLSGMADEETLRASGLFSSKEQGDGGQRPHLRPLPQAGGVSHLQRGRAGDCLYGADAGHAAEGEKAGRQVHQLAGDAALLKGPGAVQPRQGEDGDPAAWVSHCWSRARWTASASFCAESRM